MKDDSTSPVEVESMTWAEAATHFTNRARFCLNTAGDRATQSQWETDMWHARAQVCATLAVAAATRADTEARKAAP